MGKAATPPHWANKKLVVSRHSNVNAMKFFIAKRFKTVELIGLSSAVETKNLQRQPILLGVNQTVRIRLHSLVDKSTTLDLF